MRIQYIALFLLFGICNFTVAITRNTDYWDEFLNFKEINVTAPTSVENTYISSIVNFTSGDNVESCSNKTLLTTILNGLEIQVKSNVSNEYYSGGKCLGMNLKWIANLTANQNTTFYINYNTTNTSNFRDYHYSLFAYNFTESYPLFLKEFTERNSTTDCIASCGAAGIETIAVGGNALYIKTQNPGGGAYGTTFIHNNSNFYNFSVSFSLKYLGHTGDITSAYIDAGIIFRNSGNFTNAVGQPNDGYMFVFRNINNVNYNNFTLFKFVGGVQTILNETIYSYSINEAGDLWNFTIITLGNRIRVYYGHYDYESLDQMSLIMDTIDSTFTNGTIGFHQRSSNGAAVMYDEFNYSNYVITTDNYKINTISTANYSIGSAGNNDWLHVFIVSVFDLVSSEKIYFNATIISPIGSLFIPNTNFYRNASSLIPSGSITITINNASYYSPTIYGTNSLTSSTNLSIYLLPISNPNNIYVRFWVTNGNGLAVENALISIKQNGYNFGDKYTDSSGGTFFWMDSTKIYTINVTSSEGNIYRNSFTPIQNDYYISVGTSQYITFDFLFTNLTLSFFPDPRIIYPNASFINFTITSIDNKLEWFGLVLIENNTMFYNGSTVSTSGGSITAIINTTNHTQTIFVHPYFKKVGYPEYYSDTIALYVYNGSQHFNYTGLGAIVVGVRNSFGITKTNTKNNLALGISLLTIGFLFSAFIARYIGVGSGMIAMLVLVLVAFFGVFSPSVDPTTIISGYESPDPTYWGWLLWICLVVISIIVLRIIG